MPQAQPFTFDREFDRDGKRSKKTTLKYTLTADELAAAKEQAFREGAKAAEAEAARRAAEALVTLNTRMRLLAENLDQAIRPARAEAIKLAHLIARKLAPALVETRPVAEIEALIAHCLKEQRSEPNIVIRIHDGLVDAVKAEAARLAKEHGFPGRILVIGEPQIAQGDCTIEWANGGLERNLTAQLSAVDEIVRTYLHAEGMGDPTSDSELASPAEGTSPATPVEGGT